MGAIKIDKLTETNFQKWRQRIKMVLFARSTHSDHDDCGALGCHCCVQTKDGAE